MSTDPIVIAVIFATSVLIVALAIWVVAKVFSKVFSVLRWIWRHVLGPPTGPPTGTCVAQHAPRVVEVWEGQPEEWLLASLGPPDDKPRETFNRYGITRFYRYGSSTIKVRNGKVIGWEGV